MDTKTAFIVWANCSRRAETLAAELHGQVSFQYEPKLRGPWTPLRYLVQGWKTWRLLEQEQPEIVLVQSPPIFAPLLVALWLRLRSKTRYSERRVTCVIDCHTSTFYDRKWRWALPILHLLASQGALILYHTLGVYDVLQNWKAEGIFLFDGVPSLYIAAGTMGTVGESRVAVINTFEDEQSEAMSELFAAARLLPQVTFYVTGNPRLASNKLLAQKPENVMLTGFLRGGNYTALLTNVNGLVILTKEPRDLSCAAYEAVAVAKPAVISDSDNKFLFTRGFIYVENTPEAIAEGIKRMLNEQATLIPEIIAMGPELAAKRQPSFEKLVALLTGEAPVSAMSIKERGRLSSHV